MLVSNGGWIILFLMLTASAAACRPNHEWSVIFTRKGRQYAREGKFDESLAEYKKAIGIDRKNYQPYLYAADLFLGKKDCQQALSLVNGAAQLHPDIPAESYFRVGECYSERSDFRTAIDSGYNPAIERDPEQVRYFERRQAAQQALGKEKLT